DRILGRSDDMIKVKAVNIYPGQIEELLKEIKGASSEYQIKLTKVEARDHMLLRVEAESGNDPGALKERIETTFKKRIGISIEAEVLPMGGLPRSEKKSKRVFDERDL
ncbi:MAG TPA: phenylacetate--CoA ligase family protein, partial [Bacillota bacterium]|nr:phenylacetate--CoA ligase family protein [Bacillota bacterium]